MEELFNIRTDKDSCLVKRTGFQEYKIYSKRTANTVLGAFDLLKNKRFDITN
jgi:hypothetical protein